MAATSGGNERVLSKPRSRVETSVKSPSKAMVRTPSSYVFCLFVSASRLCGAASNGTSACPVSLALAVRTAPKPSASMSSMSIVANPRQPAAHEQLVDTSCRRGPRSPKATQPSTKNAIPETFTEQGPNARVEYGCERSPQCRLVPPLLALECAHENAFCASHRWQW